MQEPTETKQKIHIQSADILFSFLCIFMVISIITVWYKGLPLLFTIPFTIVILFSLYYQIMAWANQIDFISIAMLVEDRMVNEFSYQTKKRGYNIRISTVKDNPDRMDSDTHYKMVTDMPKLKKGYVKIISILNVILCPAWHYREFEGEDDLWER